MWIQPQFQMHIGRVSVGLNPLDGSISKRPKKFEKGYHTIRCRSETKEQNFTAAEAAATCQQGVKWYGSCWWKSITNADSVNWQARLRHVAKVTGEIARRRPTEFRPSGRLEPTGRQTSLSLGGSIVGCYMYCVCPDQSGPHFLNVLQQRFPTCGSRPCARGVAIDFHWGRHSSSDI